MTYILPNMSEKFKNNPPFLQNCPICGAEAEIGGQPMWEWWEHYICCTNIGCKNSKKLTTGTSPISNIVEKWNNLKCESEATDE